MDGKAETVLVPMYGRLVPFHISNIKNVSKTDESGWTFLRINFVSPGASFGGAASGMPKEVCCLGHGHTRPFSSVARHALTFWRRALSLPPP